MRRVNLIFARSRNGVIGRHNRLPWHLPEDLAHFKQITLGHPIIMGRKTWDSLGRPLPGRQNIVVTRSQEWRAEGATRAASLHEAMEVCAPVEEDVFVIGGGELYALALPQARRAFVTEIDIQVDDGDAFAPVLDETWRCVSSEAHVSAQGLAYRFAVYERPLVI